MTLDHCSECGETAYKHELIPTDVGPVHRGACRQRQVLNLETVDMRNRLWAALSLWDINQPVLVKVTLPPSAGSKLKRAILGVIVDHLTETDTWLIEDQAGKLHELRDLLALEVVEDAYAA